MMTNEEGGLGLGWIRVVSELAQIKVGGGHHEVEFIPIPVVIRTQFWLSGVGLKKISIIEQYDLIIFFIQCDFVVKHDCTEVCSVKNALLLLEDMFG
jgi:hypothetical protein